MLICGLIGENQDPEFWKPGLLYFPPLEWSCWVDHHLGPGRHVHSALGSDSIIMSLIPSASHLNSLGKLSAF